MITVISPRQEGGVRDYSQLIAEGIGGSLAFFENGECTATSAQAEDVVLIQFSGYGYQSRGVPFSLLQWAKKKKKQGVRLGVFFHELFAFGWPWNSSFWLSPAQRYIAADLGRVADFWLTNRRALAEWLLKHSGHKPHAILPTPSNVGELQQCADPRERSLIIFGGPQVRTETYEKAGDGLFNWTRSNNIQVHDIGPPLCNEKLYDDIKNQGARIHGHLAPRDVSQILAKSTFGAVSYPVIAAARSGIIAAYCAHALCPIIYADDYPPADGLLRDVHYMAGHTDDKLNARCEELIRKSAFEWYSNHSLGSHVTMLHELINF